MRNKELLHSISIIIDKKMNVFDEKINGLEEKVIGINQKVTSLEQETKTQFNIVNKHMDDIEVQIKVTEQNLSSKIDATEKILLDDIERVHEILDDHINNKAMHTA